jgi:predicted transcriptional regulator
MENNRLNIDSITDPEVELEILDVLESDKAITLQRLCRLLDFSELEISSGLNQLATKGYVTKVSRNFKITSLGKLHLSQVRNVDRVTN